MGKNVYSISTIFIVLFCIFIGNIVLGEDVRDTDKLDRLSDLGITWSHIDMYGWAKSKENNVANSDGEAYIILEDRIHTPSWTNWEEGVGHMEGELKIGGEAPKISSTLVGYCAKQISQREIERLCSTILKIFDASKIDIVEYDNLISMTGYTSLLGDSYRTSKGDVNINVASRYNSFEDRTYVFIGTPIINIEY